MDEDLPKRPREFVLGSDLDRHSIHDLEALERRAGASSSIGCGGP